MSRLNAKNIINGTFGEVWVDGEYIAECYGLQAKVTIDKESVNLCGNLMVGKKIKQTEGTGSLKLHKVSNYFARKTSQYLKNGVSQDITIISKLADPDCEAERVALSGISFDDITLADWEAAIIGKLEMPFTFSDYEVLD
ncbi:MAG: phage tail tube protein [Christensenella sp.]